LCLLPLFLEICFDYDKLNHLFHSLVLVITALVISSLSLSCKQDNADSYYKRGVINADKGDLEAALNNLNKAIELNPNFSDAYLSRGMVKSKRLILKYPIPENETDDSTYHNRSIFQEIEEADTMQDFNKAIELNPNLAKAYSARGGEKAARGDHRGAFQDYSTAVELEPDLIGELVSEGFDFYSDGKNNAEAYEKTGCPDKKTLAIFKKRGMEFLRASCISFIERVNHGYTVAIKYYNKAIELNPNWADAYYYRGLAYYELVNYKEAILDYNKAIELVPSDYRAYAYRGDAKSEQGDNIGAMQDYNKAIELKYRRAIELNPNDYESYVNRGFAYYELVNYKEAIQDFNKAIKINPNYGGAYRGRGLSKIQIGQKDSGCLDLSKAGEMGYSTAYDAIKKYCQ